jgi:RNA polymerase-binding transcription factor DksA
MPGRKPNKKELARWREVLQGLRRMIAGDIEGLEQDAFGVGDGVAALDAAADGGSDSFHLEFSLELMARDESTLGEIDKALERVDDGTFGRCEGCEGWVSSNRLKAVPYVRTCIDCQRAAEQSA